ncbi:hypothetical protein [Basfia succiniciproducens]|uniref:hypothetical protein n=1 Tax=Basfia succiniciproducens TaxID=653940 RepID=UPI003FCD7BBC
MDKQSILKFFSDNTKDKPQETTQVTNNGNMIVQYGGNSTVGGCLINDNDDLTKADKKQIKALVKRLEKRNKK